MKTVGELTPPERTCEMSHKAVSLSNNAMLYNSVDTFSGVEDNSVRMNKTDELSDFSSQSILCAMDRFVKTVNHMNETVMVPCRLLDVNMESTRNADKVPGMLRGNNNNNPYILYNVLNSIKNDLIWGPTSNDDDDNDHHNTVPSPFVNNTRWSDSSPAPTTTDNDVKGHFRRQSTLSTISMASSTSDGESEGCFDGSEGGDSGLEAEEGESAVNVMDSLRNHLIGLNLCLNSLTDTASYITDRYQDEVNA